MCGIFFYIKKNPLAKIPKSFKKIKHRGPDELSIRKFSVNVNGIKNTVGIGFHRLAIKDTTHNGMQPFEHDNVFCITNGEIYNYEELKTKLTDKYKFVSQSDCETILPYFKYVCNESMEQLCKDLDGEYATCIFNTKNNILYVATDALSVRPIFYYDSPDYFILSSEMKAFHNENIGKDIKRLPSGSYMIYDFNDKKLTINDYFWDNIKFNDYNDNYIQVRDTLFKLLKNSVSKKLVMDRDAAFLLSGGLDSSYVAQEATIQLRKLNPNVRLRTFTIGLTSPDNIKDGKIINEINMPSDIIAARKVAKSINSIHEELWFSMEDAFNSIEKVVYHNESWDQTSNRASVPMYLGVQEIKRRYPNIAVIFSGEVSDELLQGYLYNHKCPDAKSGREDMIRLLRNICYFDGLRADRMVSSSSCELRLPFYGNDIINHVLKSNPKFFMPKFSKKIVGKSIEKYILRDAIQNDPDHLMPNEIIWREKEALSDATSFKEENSWKHYIKTRLLSEREEINTEEKYYKYLFNKYYKNSEAIIPYKWMPKFVGMTDKDDPSATVLSFYKDIVKQ